MQTRRLLITIAAAALLLSCLLSCRERKAAEHSEQKSATKPAAAQAVATTATAATPDPLAARADALDKKITNWGGEGTVLEEARKEAMALLEIDRNDARAYQALARIEVREGYLSGWDYEPSKLARADRLIQHAIQLAPDSPRILETAASIALNSGYYDKAAEYIDRAEQKGLEQARVVLARMSLEERQGHFDQAIRLGRAHEADIKTADDQASLYATLADCYQRKRMPDEADAAFKASLKADPKSAWEHGNYAQFLLDRGRYAEAVEQAETAVDILPYPIGVRALYTAYARRAQELYQQGDLLHAGEIIERIEKKAGGEAYVSNMVGSYYLAASIREPAALERAERAFRRALQTDPGNVDAKKGLEQIEARRQHDATR